MILHPYLNYKYSLKDAFISIKSIFFKKEINDDKLKKLFNTHYIFYTNYARTGLWVALKALDLPPNSKIGVIAFNCYTVFNSIAEAGHEIIFLDITDNFQIDIEDLKVKKDKIDALIVTHLFGIPAPMEQIKEIFKNKVIIEDCAHSFLSKYKNFLTGTLGDIAIFSIGKGKFPSIGSGGFIILNNQKYLENINNLIKTLEKNSILFEIKTVVSNLFLSFLHNPFIYNFFTYPILKKINKTLNFKKYSFNKKQILFVNKYLFLSKLDIYENQKKLQNENAKKIFKIFLYNTNYLNNLESKNYELNYFMIPIIMSNRENIIKKFITKHIEIGKHFSNWYLWAQKFGYKKGSCPNAEKIANEILTFPTYYKLKNINN